MEFCNELFFCLKCPKSKSLSTCLTELFEIYQNKHWTISRQDNPSVDPSSHHIILKILKRLSLKEGFSI